MFLLLKLHEGVRASAAEAFALVSDPSRIPAWRPEILAVSGVTGRGVGARYDEEIAFMGRQLQTFEVVEHVPDHAFAVRAVGGFALRPTQRYRIDPSTDGTTRISYDIELPVEGRFVAIWPMLALMIPRAWRSYAGHLAELLGAA